MKKWKIMPLIVLVTLLITGCQETPEKSAVVDKSSGLDKEMIQKPLKEGETRKTDIPVHWSASEEKNDGKVKISADLELEQTQPGNLPVIEMENSKITEEKLKELVNVFAEGKELYVPKIHTKEYYQKWKDRIDAGEGAYADPSSFAYYQEIEGRLNEAIELAPEQEQAEKKIEPGFYKKTEDPAWEAARGREEETKDLPVYFTADVGSERNAYIQAENYDPKLANSSSFKWENKSVVLDESDVRSCLRLADTDEGGISAPYMEEFNRILNDFLIRLDRSDLSKEDAEEKAEQLLEQVGAGQLSLSDSQKVLWFPQREGFERNGIGALEDIFWQTTPDEGKSGYRFVYTKSVSGLSARATDGYVLNQMAESYTAPFPVETITVIVTEDGVQSFTWEGMAKEVEIVAENTKLCSFEKIQEQLFDQIFYWYSSKGQPEGDSTVFDYKISSAELGYSYITAFENPQNAWLVPTWFFLAAENVDGQEFQILPFAIQALDGSVIGG